MDVNALEKRIYDFNDDELFYRKYYYARQQEYSLKEFLSKLDLTDIKRRNLLVPEIPDTIPPAFQDSFFFDLKDTQSIVVMRHNRFAPAILHDHTFFELIYMYDGHCKQVINGKNIRLSTGDFCIVPPGVSHSIEINDESLLFNVLIRKSTLHNIFFSFLRIPNILSGFFLNNIYSKNGNDYIIFHSGNDADLKRNMLYTYWEYINKDLYHYQMISNMLILVFGMLIRNYESGAEMPIFQKKTDVQRFALLQFIQDNYSSVTLVDVAERFNYTPEYTSKLIKTTTGKSFTQILQQVRIERAQVLLQDTNLSVSDICAQIGYENTEHFIRTFKKVVNMTPTKYRKSGFQI